ncbi:HIT family protein [Nonomuraea sp. NPDC049709]|uniref:HIT family protein n=1 Tax=Nonomuraea sp. NPDC049709 TaxID=3154736 RepID=UPI0034143448
MSCVFCRIVQGDTAAHVMRAAVEVARRLTGALRAPGVNLWHASGETAWQSVFHFHVHVVPRYETTDLTPPWREVERPVESLAGLAAEIRDWPRGQERLAPRAEAAGSRNSRYDVFTPIYRSI